MGLLEPMQICLNTKAYGILKINDPSGMYLDQEMCSYSYGELI